MPIRNERPDDVAAIDRLVAEALRLLARSTGAEGALALSLAAEDRGETIGRPAASTARIGVWGLIGPLVVSPPRRRQGIGTALMATPFPVRA